MLKTFIRKIYHKIPSQFRDKYATLAWNCSDQLKRFFAPIYPQVFVFKGIEKNSQLPLAFAYVGSPSQTQEYWAQAALADGFQKHALGRCFWTSIIHLLRKNALDCNFLVIECNPWTLAQFSKKPGFHIPRWVTMEMDITMPIEKLLGAERSEIQRKIRKYQLTHEMTRERNHLDDFYHHMYLPYIKTRYDTIALLNSHQRFLEILSKGELILIKKENAIIAGGLLELNDTKVFFRMLGIRDGDPKYVHEGAIGALYYFIIVEMKKKGYQKISVGGSRPFLSDGVTKFKKSLKATVNPNDPNGRVWLKSLKNSPGMESFLINNPFIFYKGKKPHRAVFMETKENYSQQELKEALRISACNGIEETNLFIFSKIQNPADYSALLPDSSFTVQYANKLFLG
jgi:hypothetical protein